MSIAFTMSPRRWADDLFRKTQALSDSQWSVPLVFTLELVGCTVVPVPIEIVLIALVTTVPSKWARFAMGAAFGSIAGGLALYGIGRLFFSSLGVELIHFYGAEAQWTRVVEWFQSGWGISFVLLAYFTTGLFRVASLGAGFAAMNPVLFLVLIIFSRCVRFSIEGVVIKYFGERCRPWAQTYFGYVTLGAILVFITALILARVVA